MDAAEVLAQLQADAGLRALARALLVGEELLQLPSAAARLEEAVTRLVEAQARTDERLGRLEEAVTRLVEAQARTDERLGRLEEGQDALRREMGSLSRTLGGTAEEDALDALEGLLRSRHFEMIGEPTALDLDGDGDGELDLWARVRDPTGAELSVVVEAKVRLRAREVRAWAARMADPAFVASLARRGVTGPYLVYAYGIRVYSEARDAAAAEGIGVLSSRGEDVAPRSLAA